MSKAVMGAAEIAVGVVMEFIPGLQALGTMLIMAGIATEASAIAAAIGAQQGIGITTRQAAGLRQIVYGVQRIGGTTIYQSTTGAPGSSGTYVYNYIIVLATHEIDAIQNLYLDGRQVFWRADGNAANVGCGSVSNPPSTSVTISGGAITSISASGGSGFGNVQPARYRVRIQGDGSGAHAYATNSGSIGSPVWTVVVVNGGSGYTTATAEIQGKYTFGGVARSDDPDPSSPDYHKGYGIGPGGPHYNFDGKIFCEARFGDQPPGDYMSSFSAYDPTWPSTARVAGCAYIYLNVGYTTSQFPQPPEIKLTINGKNTIFDPRTGLTGFSTNWALQVADVLTDTQFGVGDQVNQAQLIAAANVCDQSITTSQGAEAQWAQHIHYDAGTSPGEVLAMMMPNAAGRVSYISGEWYIWPAYWQGPSFTFDESSLVSEPTWQPYRSFRELINRVNGTYIAPNYPYNVVGNLYDKNGWWYGVTSNEWPLAFQPTNFPQYAADALHGFGSDIYLTEDGGVQLPTELQLRGCLSIVQAQRAAKVHLMRNRFQGTGNFRMKLACYQLQPTDVMQFNFPAMSWVNKQLEVAGPFQLCCEPLDEQSGGQAPALFVEVPVNETDTSVYEWSTGEELTPYDVPALPGSVPLQPADITGLTLTLDPTTALDTSGNTIQRVLVQWTEPNDVYVQEGGAIGIYWNGYDPTHHLPSGPFFSTRLEGTATSFSIENTTGYQGLTVGVFAIYANGNTSADWAIAQINLGPPSHIFLGGGSKISGSTPNPPVPRAFADLDELGTANSAMTIATKGNPCLLGVAVEFAALSSGGGSITGITGLSLPVTTGPASPNISISTSGDGAGGGASVTWVQSGSAPNFTWTPTLNITGGANYTTATATVTVVSNGDSGYTDGTYTYPCTVSAGTPTSGIPLSVQVLMDGAVVLGPTTLITDGNGYARLNATQLLTPAPGAGNHSFQVQAFTSSSSTIQSTNRSFQLVELA